MFQTLTQIGSPLWRHQASASGRGPDLTRPCVAGRAAPADGLAMTTAADGVEAAGTGARLRHKFEATRFGHLAHRLHDAGVFDHHGDGRAGDGIDRHIALARAADGDLVGHRLADVLAGELLEALVGDADHQDRLLMLHDLDAGDATTDVEADERADRLAGIGRDAHHVGGEVGMTEQCVAAVHGCGRRLAFEFTDSVGRGKNPRTCG